MLHIRTWPTQRSLSEWEEIKVWCLAEKLGCSALLLQTQVFCFAYTNSNHSIMIEVCDLHSGLGLKPLLLD